MITYLKHFMSRVPRWVLGLSVVCGWDSEGLVSARLKRYSEGGEHIRYGVLSQHVRS